MKLIENNLQMEWEMVVVGPFGPPVQMYRPINNFRNNTIIKCWKLKQRLQKLNFKGIE